MKMIILYRTLKKKFTGIINGYTIIVTFCCFNLVWNISFDFLLVLLLSILPIHWPAFFLQLLQLKRQPLDPRLKLVSQILPKPHYVLNNYISRSTPCLCIALKFYKNLVSIIFPFTRILVYADSLWTLKSR